MNAKSGPRLYKCLSCLTFAKGFFIFHRSVKTIDLRSMCKLQIGFVFYNMTAATTWYVKERSTRWLNESAVFVVSWSYVNTLLFLSCVMACQNLKQPASLYRNKFPSAAQDKFEDDNAKSLKFSETR